MLFQSTATRIAAFTGGMLLLVSDPSQRICLVTFILAESVYYVMMWYPATVTDVVTECVESSAKRLILGTIIGQMDTMFQNSALQSPSVFSRVRLKGSGYCSCTFMFRFITKFCYKFKALKHNDTIYMIHRPVKAVAVA